MKRKTKITRSRIRKCQTWLDMVAHVSLIPAVRKSGSRGIASSRLARSTGKFHPSWTAQWGLSQINRTEQKKVKPVCETKNWGSISCWGPSFVCDESGLVVMMVLDGLPERDAPHPGDGRSLVKPQLCAEATGVLASVVPSRLGEEFSTRNSLAYSELYLLVKCFPCWLWALRGRCCFCFLCSSVDRGEHVLLNVYFVSFYLCLHTDPRRRDCHSFGFTDKLEFSGLSSFLGSVPTEKKGRLRWGKTWKRWERSTVVSADWLASELLTFGFYFSQSSPWGILSLFLLFYKYFSSFENDQLGDSMV